eukprot:3485239-Amphidinium_carterae.1
MRDAIPQEIQVGDGTISGFRQLQSSQGNSSTKEKLVQVIPSQETVQNQGKEAKLKPTPKKKLENV